MLWWLPGDLRRDPFQLAPHLPPWLSFLTPDELRKNSETVLAHHSEEKSKSEYEGLTGELTRLDQLQPELDLADDEPPKISDSSAGLTPSVTASSASIPLAVSRLKDAPSYPASDLKNLLADIRIQLEQYRETDVDRETRRNQLRKLYQRLCEIGEVVTFVKMNDPEIGRMMQASEALLTRISNSPDQLELVGRAAGTWINYSSRVTDGIAIAGEVIAIKAEDDLYFSTIRFSSKPDTHIQLVSERNPITDVRQSYNVGDHVLAFGAIINDPNRQISGFSGTGPVVWEGLHIALRKPTPVAPEFSSKASDR
ncbi:MAG: hypothetical protein GY768_08880 [Planctomycetaceae bacterium]|nr:hypothetical protein [Planctomycetaceae bacterium]